MADPPLTRIVRSLRRGQLIIPAEFCQCLGIGDNTLLQLTLHEGKIEIVPIAGTPVADVAWMREIHAMFTSIRKKDQKMDEVEMDDLIDEAVDAVRSQGDDEREDEKLSREPIDLGPHTVV